MALVCALPVAGRVQSSGTGALLSTGASMVADVTHEPRSPASQQHRRQQQQQQQQQNQKPTSSWRLVWCSERCHKKEQEAARRGLAEAMTQVGGSLVSLKKATRFATWSFRQQRPPYVLLADWRETKPCVDFMDANESEVGCRPILVVVYADTRRVFERATNWVQDMRLKGAKDRFMVVQDMEDAGFLVSSIVEQIRPLNTNADMSANTPTLSDRLSYHSLLRAQLSTSASACTPSSLTTAASSSSGAATPTTATGSFGFTDDNVVGSPLSFFGASSEVSIDWQEDDVGAACQRVRRVLSGVFANKDASELMSELELAVPEFYED